ncbi:transposase family protein [Streptomyces cyaneofuscatus]|uniref:transposase family protein n=1 Tax=Streptomyces cyaneofuscatus TaxID=66883 RepID=UPI00332115F7
MCPPLWPPCSRQQITIPRDGGGRQGIPPASISTEHVQTDGPEPGSRPPNRPTGRRSVPRVGRHDRHRLHRQPHPKLTPGRQKTANRILAVGRAPVEHGLAHLKNWRILTKLRTSPDRATQLLRALLVLTNLEVNR